MSCHKVVPQLSAYIDNELGPVETAFVEAHLAECCSCHRELLELRELAIFMRDLEPVDPEQDLVDRILANVYACPVERTVRRGFRYPKLIFASAMCFTVVTTFAVWHRVHEAKRPSSLAKNGATELDLARDRLLQGDNDVMGGTPIISASYVGR